MTNEIVIEADEFNEIGLTLIETTAEATGSEEIVKLAQYTRRLQSQLAQVTQERQLCLQVQKRGIHSSVTCPCVIAMELQSLTLEQGEQEK